MAATPRQICAVFVVPIVARLPRCRETSHEPIQSTVADKRKTFRKLHEAGCFVIPNPWNVGSARYLQGLGFKALATTSSGYAHSQGYADGALSLDDGACAFP